MLYWVHLAWVRFELITIVVMDTDYIGSYKSNYHTITTKTTFIVRSFIHNQRIMHVELFWSVILDTDIVLIKHITQNRLISLIKVWTFVLLFLRNVVGVASCLQVCFKMTFFLLDMAKDTILFTINFFILIFCIKTKVLVKTKRIIVFSDLSM